VKNELTRQGFTVDTRTREEFSAYMKSESTKWARVIKTAGIRGE
jgi:tripartite-type tricarboxylate transporter receptor subunit TctC